MPGFQLFCRFSHHFVLAKLAISSIRVNNQYSILTIFLIILPASQGLTILNLALSALDIVLILDRFPSRGDVQVVIMSILYIYLEYEMIQYDTLFFD